MKERDEAMKQQNERNATAQGMYDPRFEHENCGIGAVVNIKGKKTHDTVANALRIVEHLEHRAGKDAEGKTGDGVGILLQISHKFFKKACKKEGFDIGGEREYGIAQLKGKTLKQRSRELINIAHPDFRDELKDEFEKLYQTKF